MTGVSPQGFPAISIGLFPLLLTLNALAHRPAVAQETKPIRQLLPDDLLRAPLTCTPTSTQGPSLSSELV